MLVHPGHGAHDPSGLLHYLLHAPHAAVIAAGVVLVSAVGLVVWRRRPSLPPRR